jgi:hypothetical protein
MIFKCDNCGIVDEVCFDGYAFGDTILEGVIFIANSKGKVRVSEENANYFSDLNQKKWLDVAKRYLKETDIVSCCKCDDDIAITQEDKKEKKPIKMKALKFADIVLRDINKKGDVE